jgi:hypothetical protein
VDQLAQIGKNKPTITRPQVTVAVDAAGIHFLGSSLVLTNWPVGYRVHRSARLVGTSNLFLDVYKGTG